MRRSMARGFGTRSALVAAGLVAAVLAVYGQTLRFDFAHSDDLMYVMDNDVVKSGLSAKSAAWALTTRDASNWHPLTWLSLLLDVRLFGIGPAGFHGTNTALHALAACLLYAALHAATGRLGASAFAAALFALHPIHVESVAWISERKDVLAGVCGFASLWAYVGYARRGGALRYLGVLAWFALGLAAKPSLVTWPCVLLLLDFWPLSRWRLRGAPADVPGVAADLPPAPRRPLPFLVLEKVPLLALSAAVSVATLLVQTRPLRAAEGISLGARLANAPVAYARYLAKLVWPDAFAFYYPHPAVPGGTPLTPAAVTLAALLLVLVSALAWRRRWSAPWLLVGWLWFLGVLVPMIGLVQVGRQALADRYAYLAFPGLYLALGWSGDAATAAWRARSAQRRDLFVAGTLAVLVALGLRAFLQTRVWRDAETLFAHAVRSAPDAPFVLSGLASLLVPQGRIQEAGALLRRAYAVDPEDPWVLNNLAVVLVAEGNLDDAARLTTRLTELDPSSSSQLQLAKIFHASGRLSDAEARYREAIANDPENEGARVLLAGLLDAQGKREEADAQRVAAIEHHRRSLALGFAPGKAELRIGEIELERRRPAEARVHFEAALRVDPDDADARRGLERALRAAAQ